MFSSITSNERVSSRNISKFFEDKNGDYRVLLFHTSISRKRTTKLFQIKEGKCMNSLHLQSYGKTVFLTKFYLLGKLTNCEMTYHSRCSFRLPPCGQEITFLFKNSYILQRGGAIVILQGLRWGMTKTKKGWEPLIQKNFIFPASSHLCRIICFVYFGFYFWLFIQLTVLQRFYFRLTIKAERRVAVTSDRPQQR